MGLSTLYTPTLAAMDEPTFRGRTRIAAVAAVALLALVAAGLTSPPALAQSAGDDQYADPIVERGGQDGDQRSDAPAETDDGSDTAAAPDAATGSQAPTTGAEAGDTPAPSATTTLPRTGAPAALLAGIGLALLAVGALIRPPAAQRARG